MSKKDSNYKMSRLLVIAGSVAVLCWIFVFILFIPTIAIDYKEAYPELEKLYLPLLVISEIIGIAILYALFNYFSVCKQIKNNNSFSKVNVVSLKNIALSFLFSAIIILICLFFEIGIFKLYVLVLSLILVAVSMLSYAISRLLESAVILQEENDLTI